MTRRTFLVKAAGALAAAGLGGYSYWEAGELEPRLLSVPLGVYAVQGNRDIRINRILTSKELARQKIPELTNAGRWIERNGSRIWICGFDDST